MRLKISKRNFGYWICALAGIFSMNPYFVWPTFLGGILIYFTYLLYGLSAFYLIFYCPPKTQMSKREFNCLILFFLLYMYIYFRSSDFLGIKTLIGALLAYINLYAFATRVPCVRKEVFERFLTLFIIAVIPGLIYYMLELFGISLSIGRISSQNQILYTTAAEYNRTGNETYKLYIGAVMRMDSNIRMSGIFDEPGLIGTVAALALVGRAFDLKHDLKCRWLLFICIMSFSFAGYLIIFAYFFMRWFKRGQWKICVAILVCIIAVYGLLNVNLQDTPLAGIQRRFEITSEGLKIINNREVSTFNIGYSEFEEGSIVVKLFGFGYGASIGNPYLRGSSSYRLIIYNYGYAGLALQLILIIFLYKKGTITHPMKYWGQFVLLFLFLLSFYQRPGIFYAYYFILLYGGCAYLDSLVEKNELLQEE